MHFQVFIPEVTGVDPQHLVNCGLANLVTGASFEDIASGPENLRGSMVRWHFQGPRRAFVYKGDGSQRWVPGPDKAYWVGILIDDPPQEYELMRDYPYPGTRMRLSDGCEWLCPKQQQLPQDIVCMDDGSPRFVMQRRFSHFYQEALQVLHGFTNGNLMWSKGLEFARMGLDLNYRMPSPLHNMLSLFDSNNCEMVVSAMLGILPKQEG